MEDFNSSEAPEHPLILWLLLALMEKEMQKGGLEILVSWGCVPV